MGLDMFAFSAKREHVANPNSETDLVPTEDGEWEQIYYWRKHPNLHGWMEKLYMAKGGKNSDFNCNTVVLSTEDIDNLEEAVRNDTLPHTEGFFFGVSQDRQEEDLKFIAKAREVLAQGDLVIYDSWW